MIAALAVLATTSTGLLVGVELSVAVVINPLLTALPFSSSVAGRSHGARMLGRAMPPWYIGSTVLLAALAALTWGSATAWAALAATALLVLSAVLSVVVLVPINNRSKTWTAENLPPDWREQQRRWDSLHAVRVALIVTAFVLVAVATAAL